MPIWSTGTLIHPQLTNLQLLLRTQASEQPPEALRTQARYLRSCLGASRDPRQQPGVALDQICTPELHNPRPTRVRLPEVVAMVSGAVLIILQLRRTGGMTAMEELLPLSGH
jgi:hypothetical protein